MLADLTLKLERITDSMEIATKISQANYDISLYWNVTATCNFDCPQCVANRAKLEGEYAPEKIDIPKLQSFLARNAKKVFKFNISGGEPFLVENILEAIQVIGEKHYIGIVSNLVHPHARELPRVIDPSRVLFVNTSAHMHELQRHNLLDTFLANIELLRDAGFMVCVTEVGYPYIKDKVQSYRKIFKDRGFELNFNAFRGSWKSKDYPAAYTKKEIQLFELNKLEFFRYDVNYRKNLYCNVGYNSAIIYENGDIYPCYALKKKIGNIYEDIKLQDTMLKCPFEYCPCPIPVIESGLFERALAETNSVNQKKYLFRNYLKAKIKQIFRF